MASDTDTGKPERGSEPRDRKRTRFRWLPGTRLGRLIIALNVLGLAVLIAGALVLNELRRGLVNAEIDSLSTQGQLIATIIDKAATVGEPEPAMDSAQASVILQILANPRTQRARLFDARGQVVADSDWVADRVERRVLPPARRREQPGTLNFRPPARPLNPAVARESWSVVPYQSTHNTGGTSMGTDPRTSAVNKYCQSWECHNLFTVVANVFAQNAVYNPTGPVGALAYWTADAIKSKYMKNPRALV